MEQINTTQRPPATSTNLNTFIAKSLKASQEAHINNTAKVQVFSDSSFINSKVGAATVLFHKDHPGSKILRYHLRNAKHYTNTEAEAIGAILTCKLIMKMRWNIETSISIDSQSTIQGMEILRPQTSQQLIDQWVNNTTHTTKKLRMFGGSLRILWASAHNNINGNELVDQHAKMAAEGDRSPAENLPNFLQTYTDADSLPISYSATKQCYHKQLKKECIQKWSKSLRLEKTKCIDPNLPIKTKFHKIVDKKLTC